VKQVSRSTEVIRFGVFEVDTVTGELRKHGLRIKLQEQPFQVLCLLLARSGELVTREELRKMLWPADTFVDFEHGLNKTINKLREALSDDKETPRYIETLPRRGYRFIAPVMSAQPPPEPNGPPLKLLKGEIDSGGADRAIGAARPWRQGLLAMLLAGVTLMVSITLWLLLRSPLPPPRITKTTKLTSDRWPKGFRFATDGIRFYFGERVHGRWSLFFIPIKGGEVVPIPTPFKDVILLGGSPDGSELLLKEARVWDDGPVWVLPVAGGALRRLGDVVANTASWSPDGGKILWENGSNIYEVNRDGTGSKRLLVANPGKGTWIWNAFWSLDGRRLGFTTGLLDRFDRAVWEASTDGKDPHPILPGWENPATQCCGDWSPDGKYFVFATGRGGGPNTDQLWAKREDAGLFRKADEPVQLTSGLNNVWSPQFSRDGKKIFAISTDFRGELTRFDTKAGQFVPYLGGNSVAALSFSKDGQWITYVKVPEGGLWRARVNGGDQLSLTSFPMVAETPQLSPDGKRIAFAGAMPNAPTKIYLVPANGATPPSEALAKGPCFGPSWSPDGSSLTFTCFAPPSSNDIYTLNLRTQRLSAVPESSKLIGPHFSPDGRSLVAHDHHQISLFDLAEQKWRTLFTIVSPGHTVWSRDGQYLYFVAEGNNEESINRLRIADRNLKKLASVENLENGESEKWFTLAPDDSPIVVRSTGTVEFLALDWEAP
jgi:Tol biopolymer transport system component/DNA-binding winged helix-turn-helix (wHTH) protein